MKLKLFLLFVILLYVIDAVLIYQNVNFGGDPPAKNAPAIHGYPYRVVNSSDDYFYASTTYCRSDKSGKEWEIHTYKIKTYGEAENYRLADCSK